MPVRKILVLRGGALGDFIVTLPALAALRQAYPDAEIELVGNATAAVLAVNRSLLTRARSQHEARWAALYKPKPLPRELHEWLSGFDVVISFWPDPDRALAGHFPLRSGQQFVAEPAMPARSPAAAHYCAALEPLGIKTNEFSCRLDHGAAGDARGRERGHGPRLHDGTSHNTFQFSTIAVHPGSGSRAKNWPRERWIELIGRLSATVVSITGEAEAESWSADQIAKTPLAPRLADGSLRIADRLPLEDLVSELSACRLFLGHDSGVSHLAAACGTPSILLFGPTDPAMWAPPARHVRVIRRGDDLHAITVEEVLVAANSPEV